jgi:fibronectin-binding autotransporter adhesin
MKLSRKRNRRNFRRQAVLAGLNLSALATCGPALAHGSGFTHSGFVPVSHFNQGAGASGGNSHYFPQGNLVHPHAQMTPVASLTNLSASLSQQVNLDLSSTTANIVLSSAVLTSGNSATINIDGVKSTFKSGDMVTAAELVAISQTQHGGSQKLLLDNLGRADGGSFSLNSLTSPGSSIQVTGLVVPQNVSAYDYLTSKSNISLSGDLLNYGSIVDVAKGHGLSANISAADIINETGGTITTVGHGAHSANVDLSLSAPQDFVNDGTISASGSLNVSAPQINNSGTISSAHGNITLGTTGDQVLTVNNTGGTFSAPSGAINVRDAAYSGLSNTTVTGGNFLSQQLNLNSGGGTINANVGEVTGSLNSSGNAVHVQTSTNTLVLGQQNLSGDPTFYNDSGDIVITGNLTFSEDLAIIASGNITATAGLSSINLSDATNGHNLTMVAGASVAGAGGDTVTTLPSLVSASGPVTVTGASSTGGNIDLTGANSNFNIDVTGSNTAGNVTLIAYSSGISNGRVLLPSASQIDLSTSGANFGGTLTVIAGAKNGTAISLGSITSPQNSQIVNYQPTTAAVVFNTDGSISSGAFAADFSNKGGGDVVLNGMVSFIGNLYVSAGGSAQLNQVTNGSSSANDSSLTVTAGGNITMHGNQAAANGVAYIAGGSVVANNSISIAGGSGDVILVSGAAFSEDGSHVSISGPSNTSAAQIDLSIAIGGVTGGNVSFTAFGAPGANAGFIDFGSNTITSTGDITMVAGAAAGAGISISGALNPGTNNLTLSLSAPQASTPVLINVTDPTLAPATFTGGNLASTGHIALNTLPTMNGGNLTIVQPDAITINSPIQFIASGSVGTLTVFTGGGITVNAAPVANALSLLSNNTITLSAAAQLHYFGGIMIASGADVVTSGAASLSTLNPSFGATPISVFAGAAFSLKGDVISISGPSSTGGSIDFTTNPISFITTSGSGGTGGNITLVAYDAGNNKGVVSVPADNITTFGATGNGNLTIIGGAASGTAVNVGSIDLNFGFGPNAAGGGAIILQSGRPGTNLTFNTTGQLISGILVASFNTTQGDIAAGDLSASGLNGQVSIFSSHNILAGNIDVSNPATNGTGGQVEILANGTTALQIGGTSNGVNFINSINASGDPTAGSRGGIQVTNADNSGNGTGGIVIGLASAITNNGVGGGGLTIVGGAHQGDVVDLGTLNNISYSTSLATIAAGNIDIEGFSVTWQGQGTTPLTLTADANGATGAGGTITYETANLTPLMLTGGSSPLQISARGASGGGNGGSVIIENGGSLVFNQFAHNILVNPTAKTGTGNGGSLVLGAGVFEGQPIGSGNSALTIQGAIVNNGVGATSTGGTVELLSNSTLPFNVGGGGLNGVGNISVASGIANSGTDGAVIITNFNGSIIVSQALTAVTQLNLAANGLVGGITLNAPLGSTTDNTFVSIGLTGTGTLVQSSKALITATTLDVEGDNGSSFGTSKTAILVSAGEVQVNSVGVANINNSASKSTVAGSPESLTYLASAKNSLVTVTSQGLLTNTLVSINAGTIDLAGSIEVESANGNVNLKAGSNIVAKLNIDISAGGNVNLSAPTGVVNLAKSTIGDNTGPGIFIIPANITITAANNISVTQADAVKSLTMTATSKTAGEIDITAEASAGTTGTVTLTAANGIVAGSANLSSGFDMTLKGGAGAVAVNNAISSNGSLTINSKAAISVGSNAEGRDLVALTGTGVSVIGDVRTSAPDGTINLTASSQSVTVNGSVVASQSIFASAPAGQAVVIGGDVGSSVCDKVTIKAGDLLEIGGSVGAVSSVSLSTLDSGKSVGQIITGDITATSLTGTVSITSNSTGAASAAQAAVNVGQVQAGKSITVTAAGDTFIGGLGSVNLPSGSISVTSGSGIAVSSATVAVNSVSFTVTGKTSGGLNQISLSDEVEAVSPTGTVSMTTTSKDKTAINDVNFTDISAGKSVTLSAPNGGILLGSVGRLVSTGSLSTTSADTLTVVNEVTVVNAISETLKTPFASAIISIGGDQTTLSATGTIAINSASNGFIVGGNLAGGKSVTLNGGTDSNVNGQVSTTGGPISVVLSAGKLSLGNGAQIDAVGTKSSQGTVLLQSQDKISGSIFLDQNSSISTSGVGGGDVTLAVGKTISKTPGSPPTNVHVNGSGGTAFFGPSGLVVANTPNNNIFLLNANVIFSGASPGTITLNGNTSITADPPSSASAISVATVPTAAAALISAVPATLIPITGVPTIGVPTIGVPTIGVPTTGVALAAVHAASAFSQAQNTAQLDAISVTQAQTIAVNANLSSNSLNNGRVGANNFNWISDTEIDGGEIPVALLSNKELNISGANVASLSSDDSLPGERVLSSGAVLAAPQSDTKVHTSVGDVSIAADSVVLIMTLRDGKGLAVYNFDDRRKDAVCVSAGGRKISVPPGTSTVIVSDSVSTFEQINPAQLITYRYVKERHLNSGLKAFHAEFALPSALVAVKPLKQLITSNHAATKRLGNHLLKTMAILNQLQGGGDNFRQILRSERMACLPK